MPAQTIIKLRRGTAAQWTTANPVLAAGEVGLETDTNKTKYGDGVTAWSALPYSVADASGTSSVDWTAVLNKPTAFPPEAHTHVAADVTDLQTFVDGRVNLIVDGAPAALDTLNELAAALGDDANFAGTVTASLAGKQDKVATVTDTEIGYLGGAFPVTSSIQTQLNGKAATSHTHSINDITDYTPPVPTSPLLFLGY